MSRPPKVDHAEIRRLYATGEWTQQQLADHFGVSIYPIRCALSARVREYARTKRIAYRVPCAAGCGRLVYGKYRPGTRCRACSAVALQQHGGKRYKQGCRCDVCRAASAAQKRRQRARHHEHYRAYDRDRKRKASAA